MANPSNQNSARVKRTEQYIQNASFDEEFQVLAVENLVYNPDTGNMDRMTQPGGATSATYNVNDIEEGTTSYFGKTTSDGTYQIVKVTDTSVSYATATNNGAVTTYTDAWTNKATLTYGRFDEAF